MTLGLPTVAADPADPADPAGPAAPTAPASPALRRVWTVVSLSVLLLLMARITIKAAQPLANQDTWFHLRIGHELWGAWSLGDPGRLSSAATSTWLPTQWSTEMLAARFEDWFGLPGVAWLFGAAYLAFVLVVYLVCRRQGGPLPATVAASLAVLGSLPALSARPQVVSLVLVAVVVASWLRSARTLRVPWHLVPLTWLWATAHGLWTAGIVVGLCCWAGILADRRPPRRTALGMLAVPVLSGVAACLTPLGPALLTTQLAVGERTSSIAEWGATSFRTLPAFAVAVMICVLVMCWARAGRVPWLHVLLLLLACGWAALVTRMVSTGAILVAPLLAHALQGFLEERTPLRRPGRAELGTLAGSVVVALALLAAVVPRTADRPGEVPDGFTPRLAALPAGTPVAVEDGTGSWLEWRFPGLDPTIDGMLDAYPVDYIEGFWDYRRVEPGWQDYLRRTGARVAVLRADTPLSAAVQDQLGWRVVDEDGTWLYLVAPASR